MAMTFADLVTETQARGFSASSARVGRWVNQAYQDICARADWPFLEADSSGTAPLTISDLRSVLSVTDTTAKNLLTGVDRRILLANVDTDLTTTGTPAYWYQTSRTAVKVYPANTTNTIAVHYVKTPATLSGTDAHLIPAEFEELIVDMATIKAYKDNDNFENAAALSQFANEQIRVMMDTLLDRNHAGPGYIIQTNTYEMGGY